MSSSSCRPATIGTSYGEGVAAAAAAAGRALRWPAGSGEGGSTSNQEHPLVQAHMQAYVIQPQIRTLIGPLTRTNRFFEADV